MNITQAKQIISAISPYAKKGWAEGARVIQVSSIGSLIYGAVDALVAAILIYMALRFLRKYRETPYSLINNTMEGLGVLFALSSIIAFIFTLCACSYLFDIWVWEGIFHPSLALARSILER